MSSPSTPLSRLLEDECILTHVLSHLLDYGIHECRLVCKRWNAVCKALPVRLAAVHQQHISSVAELFPNASSMTVEASKDKRNGDACCLGSVIFAGMRQLEQIERIHFRICSYIEHWVCGDGCYGRLGDYLMSLKRLQSVELDSPLTSALATDCLLSTIDNLPMLTSLKCSLSRLSTAKPLENTKTIKSLRGTNLLVNREGNLLFPNLEHLTHLEVSIYDHDADRPYCPLEVRLPVPLLSNGSAQIALAYASTLISLDLSETMNIETVPGKWELLRNLHRLQSFTYRVFFDATDALFCAALVHLSRLTRLTALDVPDIPKGWIRSVHSMLQLRSLELSIRSHHSVSQTDLDLLFSGLKQLKLLSFNSRRHHVIGTVSSLSRLHNLRGLELSVRGKKEMLDGLSDVLSSNSRLESLSISSPNLIVPSSSLRRLEQLKTLHLYKVTVDEDLFSCMREMPLTGLSLRKVAGVVLEMVEGINRLTRLEQLSLMLDADFDTSEVFEEDTLSRLRYVSISSSRRSESVVNDIKGRLPSCRRCSVHH